MPNDMAPKNEKHEKTMFVRCFFISLNSNNKNDSKRQQTLTVDNKRLLSALFLTNVFTLQRQTQRKAMETNLPEYIEGIPTEKSESRKRREIIKNEYINLIGNLQKKRGKKAVFNDFLQADVYIIMRESEKRQVTARLSIGNRHTLSGIWRP